MTKTMWPIWLSLNATIVINCGLKLENGELNEATTTLIINVVIQHVGLYMDYWEQQSPRVWHWGTLWSIDEKR